MENFEDKYELLRTKLKNIAEQQDFLSQEIVRLKSEISRLENSSNLEEFVPDESGHEQLLQSQNAESPIFEEIETADISSVSGEENEIQIAARTAETKDAGYFERYIGENLMSKIGIVILILGVSLGVKYAIDQDLITQTMRIVMGYAAGFGLVGLALWLKKKYFDYSAILAGGGLAIMYFTTYAAYTYYGLFPQLAAFIIMLFVTVAAVFTAIRYDRQVIALIGQVGAYAIPFLLSNEEGNHIVLFSYIAFINFGILFLAFRKKWNLLYYSAFGLTWIIFSLWFSYAEKPTKHSISVIFFAFVFFAQFYATLLIYKIRQDRNFEFLDLVILKLNAFVFFILGVLILRTHDSEILRWFAVLNVVFHLIVAWIYWHLQRQTDVLFRFIIGLALIFLTISGFLVLFEFEKFEWTLIFLLIQTAVLIHFGIQQRIELYKKYGLRLLFMVFMLIMLNVFVQYERFYSSVEPSLLNLTFLVSVLCFILLMYVYQKRNSFTIGLNLDFLLALMLVLISFFMFYGEISNYWENRISSHIMNHGHSGAVLYRNLQEISLIAYGLIYTFLAAVLNIYKVKNEKFAVFNAGSVMFAVAVFLLNGFEILDELRMPSIRYGMYLLAGLNLFALYQLVQKSYFEETFVLGFKIFVNICSLWILSEELIYLLNLFNISESHKLYLSILWGIYALGMMIYGIWKKDAHIRMAAMVLLVVTLIKAFVYDLSDLDMLSRIIIFLILGVVLLLISYLYNKFKDALFEG